MANSIFKYTPLLNRSMLQKIFKQYPEENAVIELNNLLASKPIFQINIHDVEEIEKKYKINIRKEFGLNLEEFYAVFLNHCLRDKKLSNDEIDNLKHLKQILCLSDNSVAMLHTKLGQDIYKEAFEEAVSDGQLSTEEKSFLNNLIDNLGISKELADKISKEVRINYVQNYVSQVISNERLSPEEEKELYAISRSLEVDINLNSKTKNQLEKLKLYWALENLPLPVIATNISLQKNEHCHIQIPGVQWYELRMVRQNLGYTGFSTSIRIAKGIYLRSGSYTPRSYSTEQLKLIDSGSLYLTNKRIIFTGQKKNSNIRLDRILEFTPYSDGVEIGKDAGKNPVIKFSYQVDVFCLILGRLLNER